MKTLVLRTVAAMLLTTLAMGANAASLTGSWLTDTAWTLIHSGSGPADSGIGVNNLLRWDENQQIVFDLTGTTLTAGGDQEFTLSSNKSDTATFTLHSMVLDLDGPNGFASGSLDYSMIVDSGPLEGSFTNGTFMFETASFGGTPFNSSSTDNGNFS
ncbi:MAG: hypothetical protein KJO35_03205, partial [Gammaproteobacteria bacterium]|nr:hypothetical protein [Gammaproteobacteria bacterium]